MNVFDKNSVDLKIKIDNAFTRTLGGFLLGGYDADELEVAYRQFIKDEYEKLNPTFYTEVDNDDEMPPL